MTEDGEGTDFVVARDGLLVVAHLMLDESERGVSAAGAGVETDHLAKARVRFGESSGERWDIRQRPRCMNKEGSLELAVRVSEIEVRRRPRRR